MVYENGTVKVWDPLVRIGHWTLVTAFFVAYFLEDDLLTLHAWAGYVVAGVVLIRVFWGFIGGENARFRSFVRSPATTLRYLGDIATNRAKRYLGHNPAGGAMVIALIVSLVVTTYSGLEIYAIEENAGPLARFAAEMDASQSRFGLIGAAYADDDDDDEEHYRDDHESAEEFWEDVHEASANFTLFLVLLHVAGVLLASFTHRENLIRAMFSGKKNRG